MDIGGLPNKLMGSLEKHAELLAFAVAAYSRAVEANSADPVGYLLSNLTHVGMDYGPLSELMYLAGAKPGAAPDPVRNIKWKLWDAPHLPTQLGKFAALIYAGSKLTGLLPIHYENVAKKVMIGAYAAAILLPGSSGGGYGATMTQGQTMRY